MVKFYLSFEKDHVERPWTLSGLFQTGGNNVDFLVDKCRLIRAVTKSFINYTVNQLEDFHTTVRSDVMTQKRTWMHSGLALRGKRTVHPFSCDI